MLSNEAILYYANHPVEFVQDILKADPDPEQKKILQSLVTNQMTSVRSGHGIGKSAVEAWSVIWFMCTHPYPKIPCTAPTQHQLFDILWAEISKWKRNNKTLDSDKRKVVHERPCRRMVCSGTYRKYARCFAGLPCGTYALYHR